MDIHAFYTGQCFDAYRYFGAHIADGGVTFRTYAPGANGVAVAGTFDGWQGTPMLQEGQSGVFTCHIKGAKPGHLYKYRIYSGEANTATDHSDPYGFGMELRPASASVVTALGGYTFTDKTWMMRRSRGHNSPLNIYEVHLGSWRTNPQNKNGWYTYEEIAPPLIEYVKQNGYNYIEFMPLSEHPADESWGYQNTGFFAPTSRYGTARGLKCLVDMCHAAGIGVIMDFVPVHFAVDDYGLASYDGGALYEYPHEDVSYSEWGSCNFMHSRGEVRSFLQSAANYWLEEFHFDGLRMDAISRIIYWQGNPQRGVNEDAVHFLKTMNMGLHARHPSAMLMAEDSTAYPKVTAPVQYGGLGFDYKWDLGWMNDTLDYFKKSPEERRWHYHKLTFSMMYFYTELFLLPLSHDEVVHGKATIVQKMYGHYDTKFPQARAFYVYMIAHPGKKLLFMGNEFAQLREWDEKRQQDWDILTYPVHDAFHQFMRHLNLLYQSHEALYTCDYNPGCFAWLDCHQEQKCIYVWQRSGLGKRVMAAFNFSDVDQPDFVLRLEEAVRIKPLLHSNWQLYGGEVKKTTRTQSSTKDGQGHCIKLNLPAFSGVLYEMLPPAPRRGAKTAKNKKNTSLPKEGRKV